MDDSFVIMQTERSEFRAGGPEICVKNASNTQPFRYLDEHRRIFDVGYLPDGRLDDIQCKTKNVCVGFADVDKAGGNKRIHEPGQLELSNPILIQFTPFITNYGDLKPVSDLELSDQLDYLGVRFRLREHAAAKLSPGKRSLLIEDHST